MEVKRNYYVCEGCNLVTCNLATHLKRKCMKGKTKPEIDAALGWARDRVYFHIRDHIVLSYEYVQEKLNLSEKDIAQVVAFLEDIGHTVTKRPPIKKLVISQPFDKAKATATDPTIQAAPILTTAATVPTAPILTAAPTISTAPILTAAPTIPTAPILTAASTIPTAPILTAAATIPTAPILTAAPTIPTAPIPTAAATIPTLPILTAAPFLPAPRFEPMEIDQAQSTPTCTSESSTDEELLTIARKIGRNIVRRSALDYSDDDEEEPQSAAEAEDAYGPGALQPQEEPSHSVASSTGSNLIKTESADGRKYYIADPLRQKMRDFGLYCQFPLDMSYIGEFNHYMRKEVNFKEPVCKTKAQYVSRLLYFVDPKSVNLHALEPEKVYEFFQKLSEAGVSFLTKRNYQQAFKSFLIWMTTSTDVSTKDRLLYTLLRNLEDCLAKWTREELTKLSKRNKKTVDECQVILRVAANDFKSIIKQKGEIRTSDYVLVLNYLTALLSLKHFQRRSVLECFKVEEWATGVELKVDGRIFWIFYAQENQRVNTQPATFCLEDEEYTWFQTYFERFRPRYAALKNAQSAFFFLSTNGKKVHNAANDLNRFHRKYKLAVNTAGEARRAMASSAKARLKDNDLALVEDYLAHSANVDEQFYEFNQPINVCRVMLLMSGQNLQIKVPWAANGPDNDISNSGSILETVIIPKQNIPAVPEVSARNIPAAHYALTNADLTRAFDKLVTVHPVNLDGKPPSKILAASFYFIKPRSLIDKWAYAQRAFRIRHIIDLFPRRRPRRAEVAKMAERNKWPPSLVTKVMQKWTPTNNKRKTTTAIEEISLEDRIAQQSWPGLCMGRNQRGNVIFTGKAFKKGEIVLDYHGEVMNFKEGLKRQSEVKEDGYIFFLKHKDLAIDASKEHCKCHPNTILFGRLISHSRKGKRINLKPGTITINGKTCIIFRALRDLKAGEELFFDYGVRRKQYNEGHDLIWIDS